MVILYFLHDSKMTLEAKRFTIYMIKFVSLIFLSVGKDFSQSVSVQCHRAVMTHIHVRFICQFRKRVQTYL